MSDMPETTTVEATFVFADIAGFTALTEAHGDHDAAALVAEFCRVRASCRRAAAPRSRRSATPSCSRSGSRRCDPLGLRITHELMRGTAPRPCASASITARRSSATATTSARRSTSRHGSPARQAAARCCSPPARRRARPSSRGCSTSRVAAGRSETCASPWSCSRPSARVSRASRRFPATPSAGWPSIPSARPAAHLRRHGLLLLLARLRRRVRAAARALRTRAELVMPAGSQAVTSSESPDSPPGVIDVNHAVMDGIVTYRRHWDADQGSRAPAPAW